MYGSREDIGDPVQRAAQIYLVLLIVLLWRKVFYPGRANALPFQKLFQLIDRYDA